MDTPGYQALPKDGKAILQIMERSETKGTVGLLFTRRPDPIESYEKDAKDACVYVSRKEEKIIGTCAELVREMYIGNRICRTAYICGLKKDPDFGGYIGFGPGFVRTLRKEGVDAYYCSVFSDNDPVIRSFDRLRYGLSPHQVLDYHTFMINPKVRIKCPRLDLSFHKACEADRDELLAFLNEEGQKHDMFPVFRSIDQFCGLQTDDFFFLKKGREIVAAAAVWDQSSYKQYFVNNYSGWFRIARMFNPLLSALGFIRIPPPGTLLDFPILSFLLVRDDREDHCRFLLHHIFREISARYRMFAAGMPKSSFAYPIFKKIPSIRFSTVIYELMFPQSDKSRMLSDLKNPDFELGLM